MISEPSLPKIARLIVSLIGILVVCEGSRYLVYNGRRWFRKHAALFTFLTGLILTAVALAVFSMLSKFVATGRWNMQGLMESYLIVDGEKVVIGLVCNSLLTAIFIFPILFGAYEFIYHSAQLKHSKAEREKLENDKLKVELQQLKGIVNPHFLFNNLNSLSSLMTEDVQQAQFFLNELTKVFRYLLRNNETELTTLAQELEFIRSYYQLLQIRYGRGISMDIQVDDKHFDLLLPPLTLQMLVENAAKHNQISKDMPLKIELYSNGTNELVIKNNLLPRKTMVESTGIGLQNINGRYRMLKRPGIDIRRDDASFGVVIHLVDANTLDAKQLDELNISLG
jgi:two-component system, LytTR family, sensor kinase